MITGGTAEDPGHGEPGDWTGYIDHNSNNFLGIINDEGRGNSPALKIGPDYGGSAGDPFDQVGLVKWLGEEGYDELYIRYYLKYDDLWRWGD